MALKEHFLVDDAAVDPQSEINSPPTQLKANGVIFYKHNVISSSTSNTQEHIIVLYEEDTVFGKRQVSHVGTAG